MNRREALERKLEAEIARLMETAERGLDGARERYPQRMRQLEARIEAAKARLAALTGTGDRLEALERRVQRFRSRLGEKRRPDGPGRGGAQGP